MVREVSLLEQRLHGDKQAQRGLATIRQAAARLQDFRTDTQSLQSLIARVQQEVAREWNVPVEPGSRLFDNKIFLDVRVPVRTALDALCLIGLQRFARKVFDFLASLDSLGTSLRNHGYLLLTATYRATSLPTLESRGTRAEIRP
jgi:hypothetical protein